MKMDYRCNFEFKAPLGGQNIKGDDSHADVGMENQLGFKINLDKE